MPFVDLLQDPLYQGGVFRHFQMRGVQLAERFIGRCLQAAAHRRTNPFQRLFEALLLFLGIQRLLAVFAGSIRPALEYVGLATDDAREANSL